MAGLVGLSNINMSEKAEVGEKAEVEPKNQRQQQEYEDCVERFKANWDNEMEFKKEIDNDQLKLITEFCKNAYLEDFKNLSLARKESLQTQVSELLTE